MASPEKDSSAVDLYSDYPKELLYKVLVIGDFGVGKTSIIRRYTEGYFTPSYKLTIGVDFSLKTLIWTPTTHINLQLWDIAGHERFGHMTRVYYKYAIAAIVVFDLTKPSTFEAVPKWIDDVHSKVMLTDEKPIPCFLFANKCDIEDVQIDTEGLNSFCQEHNIIAWYPTSAKDDINIDTAMSYMVQHILNITDDESLKMERYSPLHDSLIISEEVEEKDSKCCGRTRSVDPT